MVSHVTTLSFRHISFFTFGKITSDRLLSEVHALQDTRAGGKQWKTKDDK